jgi:hypothetical protein
MSCGKDNNGVDPGNSSPVIESITADPDTMLADEITTVTVVASDPDGDILQYEWEARKLELSSLPGSTVMLEVCDCEIHEPTTDVVISTVSDGRGGVARDSVSVHILPVTEGQ